MRVTVDAIKITLLVYGAFARDAPSRARLTRYERVFYIHHARITPVPFVRTEVGRLNCQFRDDYASSG